MAVCEWCGKSFLEISAAVEFDYFDWKHSRPLDYRNLRKCLCGKCAISVIENRVDGVYYETCEFCGKTFDLLADDAEFYSHFSYLDCEELRDHWDNGVCCCDCALKQME